MKDNLRFYELDLFRFLAAFSVMIYHYCFRGFAADNMSIISFAPFDGIAKYGFMGVELFFMISGFVILFTAQGSTPAKFTASRIARLYPAFWVCMTITALTTIFIGGTQYSVSLSQYIYNLSLISSIFGVEDVDGVYWTILVEIRFYFLIFILITLGLLDKIKHFLAIWLICSIISQFIALPYSVTFFLLPDTAPYFIAGACFFLIRKEGTSLFNVLLLAGSYFYAIFILNQHIKSLENHYLTSYDFMIIITIFSSFYVLFLAIAYDKLKIINKPYMLSLGVLTYPLYLLHQNIGYMIFNAVGSTLPKWVLLFLVIVFMLGISLLVHYKIEKVYGPKLKRALNDFFQRRPYKYRKE